MANLSSDDYLEIGGAGLDAPNDRGQYTRAELVAEMRNRGDRTVGEQLDYFTGLRDEGFKFNRKARNYLNEVRQNLNAEDSGGSDAVNPTVYAFDPAIAGAIERSANYRDRAVSGQQAQDIFGKNALSASHINDGIPVSDPAAGWCGTKAQQAADSEIHRSFDPEQFKESVANRARQAVISKFA